MVPEVEIHLKDPWQEGTGGVQRKDERRGWACGATRPVSPSCLYADALPPSPVLMAAHGLYSIVNSSWCRIHTRDDALT